MVVWEVVKCVVVFVVVVVAKRGCSYVTHRGRTGGCVSVLGEGVHLGGCGAGKVCRGGTFFMFV